MARTLSDISNIPAHRCFFVQGDDQRFHVTITAEHKVIPAEAENDIFGNIYAQWQALSAMTNEDAGKLLIAIGNALMANPEGRTLDEPRRII